MDISLPLTGAGQSSGLLLWSTGGAGSSSAGAFS